MGPRPLLLLALAWAGTGAAPGRYAPGDPVPLYVNTVGPYHNPGETYGYYALPVCRPGAGPGRGGGGGPAPGSRPLALAPALALGGGDCMAASLYRIRFRHDAPRAPLCTLELGPDEVAQLRAAVEALYYFEFVVDELRVRGFVGAVEEGGLPPHGRRLGLWTHLDFHLAWRGDRVVAANLSTGAARPQGLPPGPLALTHTYGVRWSRAPAGRGQRQAAAPHRPPPPDLHRLALLNGAVLVALLGGFVAVVLLRVLRTEGAPAGGEAEAAAILEDPDGGWKAVRGDVFRPPPWPGLLSALLGAGCQLLALAGAGLALGGAGGRAAAWAGPPPSSTLSRPPPAGYVAGGLYRRLGGRRWVANGVLTSGVFAGPFFATWSVVNAVHWAHGSTRALPAAAGGLLLAAWLLVGLPLVLLGAAAGRSRAGPLEAPGRTKSVARPIPPQPWYRAALVHAVVGGFLPFSAISVELYYVFATVWGREPYALDGGVLACVFAIPLAVGACLSVALTYFQLSGEDYRWWWHSALSTGSTGLFLFLYALFYYCCRSNMSGPVQTVEFFGYCLLAAYAASLMVGTVAFFASFKFIRYIYVNLKMD
ncbi:LOW QUALITY PROTEIN: transmembrane 9 superfamily member 1 [Apteryx mantelli]|uniref:Transmembrane 9 superfamily member n=1 Tax=Apteryx mantelli TaxID=2696672 RepID=A0ABM4G1J7_9AVES